MTIRTVVGKILRAVDESPLRDTLIEVWDRDFGLDDLLGTGTTKDDGMFCIEYDTEDAGDTPDLSIKIIRLNPAGERVTIEYIYGPNNIDADYDFGVIEISGWEYDKQFVVPLVLSDGSGLTSSPQNFEDTQTAKILLNGTNQGIRRKLAENEDTIAEVQNFFDKSKTQIMEENNPGSSRSDEFLVDSVLNGFNPAKLSYNDSANTYHVRYNIDNYTVDTEHQSPSVHLILEKDNTDNLVLKSISYQLRDIASNNPPVFSSMVTVTPNDDPADWGKAKEYFRIADFIDGQVKGHLGRSHINAGQYAVALYRNIQKSPILQLLHPHLKGVTAINTFGKDIIFGADGILALTPLTVDSLVECMRDDLGDCDWQDWSPREEVSKQHRYARVQHIYWGILNDYIDAFFETHIDKIKKDWKEIYYFSKDLVKHSVNYFSYELPDNESWCDTNEVSYQRATDEHSITAITKNITHPDEDDIERLKQACRYAIYHATIWHDWRNDNQKNYGGEIDYARLSINFTVKEAAFQLFIVNVLVDVKYGYLSKNEDEDIPRHFVHLLKQSLPDFEKEGYDLRDLRSRINI